MPATHRSLLLLLVVSSLGNCCLQRYTISQGNKCTFPNLIGFYSQACGSNDKQSAFDTISTIISTMDQLSPILMGIGQIFSLLSSMFGQKMSQNATNAKVVEELGKSGDKFEYVDGRFDDVIVLLNDGDIGNNFRTRWDQVKDLEDKFTRFTIKPGNATFDNFMDSCSRNSMEDMISYLYREMTMSSDDQISLLSTLTRNSDRHYFQRQAALVIGTFVQSSNLRLACIGTRTSDARIRQAEKLQEAAEDSTLKYAKIVQAVMEADDEIQMAYTTAENDTLMLMGKYSSMDNGEFVKMLFNFLKTKFYWRLWFVGSYNGDTKDLDDVQAVGTGKDGFFWMQRHGRSVLVASRDPEQEAPETNKIFDYCLRKQEFIVRKRNGKYSCRDLYEHVEHCMGIQFNLLACVRHGRTLGVNYDVFEGISYKEIQAQYQFLGPLPRMKIAPLENTKYNFKNVYSIMYVA